MLMYCLASGVCKKCLRQPLNPKPMITYTKTITESRPCDYCKGVGHKYETVYHNQLKQCTCYLCLGSGQRNFTWSVDITQEVVQLLANMNSLTQKV